MITQTTARLADGRELIYFDRGPRAHQPLADQRELPPQPEPGQARLDPVTGDWVIIASHRQNRIFLPAADDCPLCPSRPGHLTEIPDPTYAVAVFANRFPALIGAGAGPWSAPEGALHGQTPATGRCEVVVFDPRHDVSFAELSVGQVEVVLAAWSARTQALLARPDIVQVFCFENRGTEIGVTQFHPHGQIYAYPTVLPRTARMLQHAVAHRARHGRNLFDDIVAAELESGERIVATNADWVAFVPWAARYPYEVHLYPRSRVPHLPALTEGQRSSLASIYLDLVRRLNRLFESTPYIAAWHQAPTVPGAEELALHLELFTIRRTATKLKYLAGTESGMDAFSNDIVPEEAARVLRES